MLAISAFAAIADAFIAPPGKRVPLDAPATPGSIFACDL
jgi:hypothetical protein